MKILQCICLHVKDSITQTAHYNTFHFLKCAHFRFAKCLFTNIQKQYFLREFLGFKIRNFQGIIFVWTQKYLRYFQIFISVPLRREHLFIKTFWNSNSKCKNVDIVPLNVITLNKTITIEAICSSPDICDPLTRRMWRWFPQTTIMWNKQNLLIYQTLKIKTLIFWAV